MMEGRRGVSDGEREEVREEGMGVKVKED